MKTKLISLIFLSFSIISVSYSQQKNEKGYNLLHQFAESYKKINSKNQWAPISLKDKTVLKLNDKSDVLPAIRERLRILGDLKKGRDDSVFTQRLEDAVKQYQQRHGLEDDGIIGPVFMKALNTPLEKRIEQMTATLERISQDTGKTIGTRIIANIPEYKLYVMEGETEVLTMDIVVGKISNPTDIFTDTLESIVFSPYWNIPKSIVRNEILPAISRNSSYLEENNMEITGNVNGLPRIRQKPGPDNSLGSVKFIFPNKYNIYFHDTPAQALFERNKRAFSHGCIRLSQPYELAEYLLKDQEKWTGTEIIRAMGSGTEKWVKLDKKIPVAIIYYTAWVDNLGLLNFRPDIYGHDEEDAEQD